VTTYPVREDQALADAFTELIRRLGPDREAVAAASELRSAATPKNGWPGPANVPFHVRGRLAHELRAMAAEGHPLAGQLEGHAAGLDASVRHKAVAEGRPDPMPPAPEPQPEPARPGGY
jgi:hypothetical protein